MSTRTTNVWIDDKCDTCGSEEARYGVMITDTEQTIITVICSICLGLAYARSEMIDTTSVGKVPYPKYLTNSSELRLK